MKTETVSHFEEWSHIKRLPDYIISDHGRVMRITSAGNNFCRIARILRPRLEKNGYYRLGLFTNGKVKRESVHRLVAEAFLGEPPSPLHEVAHNDGVRHNNHVSNLRWATRKENHADKKLHGTSQCGSNNGNSKLKDWQAKDIISSNKKLKEIANDHDVAVQTVWNIRSGRSWAHLQNRFKR